MPNNPNHKPATTDKRHDGAITVTDKAPEDCEPEDIKNRKKRAVLQAILYTGGNLSKAIEVTGVARASHYKWMKHDPVYTAVYDKQYRRSITILETEAIRRAIDGVAEDVYHNGMVVGSKMKYSDNLLMFLMKQRDPSYRDNQPQTNVGIWGSDGNVNIEFNIPRPPKQVEATVIDP